MIRYEYRIVDSRIEEHTVVASGMNIKDGYTCFYSSHSELLHAFYQPISTLCFGEYNEKDTYL